MKKFKIILILFLSLLNVSLIIFIGEDSTDIEIYTEKNIYYIKGLTVTNEANDKKIKFAQGIDLKNYISKVTANDLTE